MAYTVIGRIRPRPMGTWSAERAYETLDVVMAADGDRAYMAAQSVPAGTALESAAYWAPVVDIHAAAQACREIYERYDADVVALGQEMNAMEALLRNIQEKLDGASGLDAITVAEINNMIVTYFENKTAAEVQA